MKINIDEEFEIDYLGRGYIKVHVEAYTYVTCDVDGSDADGGRGMMVTGFEEPSDLVIKDMSGNDITKKLLLKDKNCFNDLMEDVSMAMGEAMENM